MKRHQGLASCRRNAAAVVVLVLVALLTPTHASGALPASDPLTQALRGITLPAGFGLTAFAQLPGLLPTGVAFGPDGRLYVAAIDGASGLAGGSIRAFDDLGGVGGPGETVADGFDQLLGITFGPDGTLYAADSAENKGRIQALTDADGGGVFEQRRTVLHNIPNGRHQTNGMAFGPDDMLYVANGNATDNGVHCGPPADASCPTPEVKPWSGAILRVDPAWDNVDLLADVRVDDDALFAEDGLDDESVLVSPGYRNIYGVDFWPGDPSMIYTAMNGSDFPASNEPLYRTKVDDVRVVAEGADGNPVFGPVIDDAGFPSCLYGPHNNSFPVPSIGGHDHPDDFTPEDNPTNEVITQFGACAKGSVLRPIMFFDGAHNGTSGVAFERGGQFPERYDSDLFVAEWGSIWNLNGGEVSGHKLTHIDVGPDGLPERSRPFMTGVTPIDVTFGPDGAMYVADFAGVVYRIVHVADTPDSVTVEMRAGQFVPQVVFVAKDTRVAWVNFDDVNHNVTALGAARAVDPDQDPVVTSGAEINSRGDIPPRESHAHQFGDEAGAWGYGSTTSATDTATMHGGVVVLPVDR